MSSENWRSGDPKDSLQKRKLAKNISCEHEFYLHENKKIKKFTYQ